VDSGRFHVEWDIQFTGGAPASCGDAGPAGADGLSVLSTLAGPNSATDDVFPCSQFAGDTGDLPLGDYTIAIDLLKGNNPADPRSSPAIRSGTIDLGEEVVDLQPVLFVVQ